MSKRTMLVGVIVVGTATAVGLGVYLARGGAAGKCPAGPIAAAAENKADSVAGASERVQIFERLSDRIYTQSYKEDASQIAHIDHFSLWAGRVTRVAGTQYFIHLPFEHHLQIGVEDAAGLLRFWQKLQGKKLEAAGVTEGYIDWSCTPLTGFRFSAYRQMFVVYDLKNQKFFRQMQYGNGEWSPIGEIDNSFFGALAAAIKDVDAFKIVKASVEP